MWTRRTRPCPQMEGHDFSAIESNGKGTTSVVPLKSQEILGLHALGNDQEVKDICQVE
jgi:hypothetical protein